VAAPLNKSGIAAPCPLPNRSGDESVLTVTYGQNLNYGCGSGLIFWGLCLGLRFILYAQAFKGLKNLLNKLGLRWDLAGALLNKLKIRV
jgi:hypothetical protein